MVIKPNLKKNSALKYDYYISSNKGYSSPVNKSSFQKRPSEVSLKQHIHHYLTENENGIRGVMNFETKVFITKISRKNKNKRVNYFILNLCFCDLMIVIWCSWIHMVNSVSENWIMGAFFCRFNTYVQSKLVILVKCCIIKKNFT